MTSKYTRSALRVLEIESQAIAQLHQYIDDNFDDENTWSFVNLSYDQNINIDLDYELNPNSPQNPPYLRRIFGQPEMKIQQIICNSYIHDHNHARWSCEIPL